MYTNDCAVKIGKKHNISFHRAVVWDQDSAWAPPIYTIKRKIKLDIPIRIWLKIFESLIEPIALYGCEVSACRILQKYPPCTT
jgi:hypothetical protein